MSEMGKNFSIPTKIFNLIPNWVFATFFAIRFLFYYTKFLARKRREAFKYGDRLVFTHSVDMQFPTSKAEEQVVKFTLSKMPV